VDLVLHWEKLQVAVPITADVNGRVLADARTAMTTLKPDDWRTPYQAAGFCFNAETALEEAEQWLAKSLAIQQNYNNLTLRARWLLKAGKKQDAIATAEKAIAAGKASKDSVDTSGTEKLLAEWKGK
jgi:tetratricopeptide (TPR) repeat protein